MKKNFQNSLIIFFTLLLFFGVAEAIVRASGYGTDSAITSKKDLQSVIDFDPILESRYKPNSQTTIQSQYKEFSIRYQFNAEGLRDTALDNLSNQYKVLVLGNSFVEGWGVNRDKCFLQIAQNILNQDQLTNSKSIRLINAGISGYGAIQSYLFSKKLVQKIKPDAIIFFYLSTMANADAKFLEKAELDKNSLAVGVNQEAILNGGVGVQSQQKLTQSVWIGNILDWFSHYSAFANLIKTRLTNYAAQKQIIVGNPTSDLLAALRTPINQSLAIQMSSFKHINAISEEAKTLHIPFLVILLPMPHQLSEVEWEQGRKAYGLKPQIYDINDEIMAEKFFHAQRIPFISAYAFLKSHVAQFDQNRPKLYYSYDFHLNERGQTLLGRWFAESLKQNKMVTARAPS